MKGSITFYILTLRPPSALPTVSKLVLNMCMLLSFLHPAIQTFHDLFDLPLSFSPLRYVNDIPVSYGKKQTTDAV